MQNKCCHNQPDVVIIDYSTVHWEKVAYGRQDIISGR